MFVSQHGEIHHIRTDQSNSYIRISTPSRNLEKTIYAVLQKTVITNPSVPVYIFEHNLYTKYEHCSSYHLWKIHMIATLYRIYGG